MALGVGQSFSAQLRDRFADEEFDQFVATMQRQLATAGKWTTVPFVTAQFWPDAGTWTPTDSTVQLFKWMVFGSTMVVQLEVFPTGSAVTGTVKYLNVRVPNTGYKIVPAQHMQPPTVGARHSAGHTTCLVYDGVGTVLGTLAADADRTDGIVLFAVKFDASAMGGGVAGFSGQVMFEVQPQ